MTTFLPAQHESTQTSGKFESLNKMVPFFAPNKNTHNDPCPYYLRQRTSSEGH